TTISLLPRHRPSPYPTLSRSEPISIGSNPMGGAGPTRHAKDSTMPQTRPTAVIVLAAGQGTRMKSALPNVMHPIGGRSLLHHAVSAADGTRADHLVVVVRHEREQLVAHLDSLPLASQRSLLIADQDEVPGTGRATECALTQLPADIRGAAGR